ncbi:MAG TPA: response regulator [Candidatus Limnocylindria bacterium]|nr:response regulator [Candidatus Limnocylindria bacterium]
MGFFSKRRGGGASDDGVSQRPSGPQLTVKDLGDALVEISQAVSAPEDALEPALQAVVEASGAAAGALCLYDVRQCVLRLACEVGLSDEGCDQLQTVRRGDPACWDMPLHGLLNRRAYLIESAARNRYVPKLLQNNRAVGTVICIPLYEGITPLASLVLVSTAPRLFGQADITALWKPLRELGRMIDRIRRRGFDAEPQVAPFREQIALQQRTIAAERDRLLQEMAAHRAERERLAQALEEQVAGNATLRTELERVIAERDALRANVDTRRDDEGQLAGLRESLAQAERERERVMALLEETRAENEHRLRETRLELEIQLAAARERTEAAQARLEGLARELTASQDRVAHLEQSLSEAHAERGQLQTALESLRADHAGATARVAELEAELAALREERDAALARADVQAEPPAAVAGEPIIEMATEAVPEVPAPEADASVTVISVPADETVVPVAPTGQPAIVVLDGAECWNVLEVPGHAVYTVMPDAAAAAAVAALNPTRVIVNLTAQGAVNTLGALRKAGYTARFWGCIADGRAKQGLPLMAVEPVIPPLEPDTIIRKLGDYVCKGARILTVGGDVDALMSLRQALARKGVSVSMAWDAKQAIEVMHQVRPDAVVVDLDIPKGDGYTIAVSAANLLDPAPFMVLLGGRVNSGEGFTAALEASGDKAKQVGIDRLLDVLATRTESPPHEQEDRRKPKPIGYGKWGRRVAQK